MKGVVCILLCRCDEYKIKIKISKSNVISVLMYGSETWKLSDEQLNSLRVFQTTYTRQILKIRWYLYHGWEQEGKRRHVAENGPQANENSWN
mgnify:CR=1 FL=1